MPTGVLGPSAHTSFPPERPSSPLVTVFVVFINVTLIFWFIQIMRRASHWRFFARIRIRWRSKNFARSITSVYAHDSAHVVLCQLLGGDLVIRLLILDLIRILRLIFFLAIRVVRFHFGVLSLFTNHCQLWVLQRDRIAVTTHHLLLLHLLLLHLLLDIWSKLVVHLGWWLQVVLILLLGMLLLLLRLHRFHRWLHVLMSEWMLLHDVLMRQWMLLGRPSWKLNKFVVTSGGLHRLRWSLHQITLTQAHVTASEENRSILVAHQVVVVV